MAFCKRFIFLVIQFDGDGFRQKLAKLDDDESDVPNDKEMKREKEILKVLQHLFSRHLIIHNC